MKNILSWVKRPANMNFLAFTAVALALVFFAIGWYNRIGFLEEKVAEIGSAIAEKQGSSSEDFEEFVNSYDDISDFEEFFTDYELDDFEKFIIGASVFTYNLGTKWVVLMNIIVVYIPLILAVFAAIQAVFLRLLYKAGNKNRILCYRVFMGLSCFVTAVLISLYVIFILSQITLASGTVIVFSIITLVALIICIINTYSKRIYDKEKVCIN